MNPYEILDVPRDVDLAVIKAAYRRLAAKHHPDREGGDHEKMQDVQKAYDILSDPEKRARYDRSGQTENGPDLASIVKQQLNVLVQHVLDSHDADYTNIVSQMLEVIEANVRDQNAAIKDLERKILGRRSALKRLKKRGGGESMIATMIEFDIVGKTSMKDQFQHTLTVLGEMAGIVKQHDYKAESGSQPRQQPTRSVFIQFG